jgi:hypothetical protein
VSIMLYFSFWSGRYDRECLLCVSLISTWYCDWFWLRIFPFTWLDSLILTAYFSVFRF